MTDKKAEIIHEYEEMKNIPMDFRYTEYVESYESYMIKMKDLNEFSQIVTICDVFEAYTSRRIYHPHRSLKEGFDYLLYLSCNKKVNDKFTKVFIDNMI